MNVLNKVPKSVQANMMADLREVYDAPDRATVEAAIAVFVDKYTATYPKTAVCLTKDRDALLAFFDFRAEHWDHRRTANLIESVFSTAPSNRRNKIRAVAHDNPFDDCQVRHRRFKKLAPSEV